MKYLTLNEEVLLLAIWKLKDNAYAVSVRDKVIEMTKKNVVYGTLYNSLDYLLKKRLVTSRKGEPTAERGGKRKIYYTLTTEGLSALKASREFHQTIWEDVTDIAFGGSGK
jgi:DNA-binding PadR family transcriptional regulator